MRLKMKTSLCGPDLSLANGDEHTFSAEEGARLVEAGFAEEVKPETPAQKVTRLEKELAAAKAAAKPA